MTGYTFLLLVLTADSNQIFPGVNFQLADFSTLDSTNSTLASSMASEQRSPTPPVPLVIIAAWFIPGLGYWLLGQKARALTVGISIIGLFLAGLLLGGIRIIEVPMFNELGQYNIQLVGGKPVQMSMNLPNGQRRAAEIRQPDGTVAPVYMPMGGIGSEIRSKPWFVAQVMTGPISLASAALSVYGAGPKYPENSYQSDQDDPIDTGRFGGFISRAPVVHSRTWEIPTLYTAIAGMLNLVVILDSAHRAGKAGE